MSDQSLFERTDAVGRAAKALLAYDWDGTINGDREGFLGAVQAAIDAAGPPPGETLEAERNHAFALLRLFLNADEPLPPAVLDAMRNLVEGK